MQRLQGDIMIIIDSGMDEEDSVQFQRQVRSYNRSISTQAVPALKKRQPRQVLPKGGIIVLINAKWSHSVGQLHTDASSTGLLAKMKVKAVDKDLTLIIGYWPIP